MSFARIFSRFYVQQYCEPFPETGSKIKKGDPGVRALEVLTPPRAHQSAIATKARFPLGPPNDEGTQERDSYNDFTCHCIPTSVLCWHEVAMKKKHPCSYHVRQDLLLFISKRTEELHLTHIIVQILH